MSPVHHSKAAAIPPVMPCSPPADPAKFHRQHFLAFVVIRQRTRHGKESSKPVMLCGFIFAPADRSDGHNCRDSNVEENFPDCLANALS